MGGVDTGVWVLCFFSGIGLSGGHPGWLEDGFCFTWFSGAVLSSAALLVRHMGLGSGGQLVPGCPVSAMTHPRAIALNQIPSERSAEK